MRMYFQPEEEDEYQAACCLLVHRLGRRSHEQDPEAIAFTAQAALDYRHSGTCDGRLALWEPRHVEGFLLEWMPRTVTVLPGEPLPGAPETLRLLLRYLDETGLADPRGATVAENEAAIDATAPHYAAAMADRDRWGLAKFWAVTAAEAGVNIHDQAAMQRFVERARRDEVTYDAAVLERIVRRHHTRGPGTVGRAEPQLPVTLPDRDGLRALAEASLVVRRLRDLVEWIGPDGRALTATGRLRVSDALELVRLLQTGDTAESPRSSADLPRLALIVEWAKKARLVRTAKGRLYAVNKAKPVLADALALWQRAFEAVFSMREPLIGARGGWWRESMLYEVYEDVLPDVLNSLYSLPYPMPWPALRASVHLAYREYFGLGAADDGQQQTWFRAADSDLRTVLSALQDLGCVDYTHGKADPVFLDSPLAAPEPQSPAGLLPEPAPYSADHARELHAELSAGSVELISLTALGTWSVRSRLLTEGRDAPLIGELAHAPAPGLLGVLAEHYDPESARAEAAAWMAAHSDRPAAMELLTDAVRTMPFRTRAQAMLDILVQVLPDDEGTRLLRTLRTDAALAPTALILLLDRELLSPEELTEPEALLMMAEGLLQLLEAAGPDQAVEVLLKDGRHNAREAVAAALASGHPDHDGLEELRGLAADRLAPQTARGARTGAPQARTRPASRQSPRRKRRR